VIALLRLSAVAVGLLAASAGACAGHETSGRTGCVRAKIAGHVVCLHKGLRCKRRYEHRYVLYGFTCRRAADGRFRLRERNFIAPPNP
jgi:hypothetical protein